MSTNYRTSADAIHDRIQHRVKQRVATEAVARLARRSQRIPRQVWLIFYWTLRGWEFFGARYTKRAARKLRHNAPVLAHLADVEVRIESFTREPLR